MLVLSHGGVLRARRIRDSRRRGPRVTGAVWHGRGPGMRHTPRVDGETSATRPFLGRTARTGRVASGWTEMSSLRGWGEWGFVLGDDRPCGGSTLAPGHRSLDPEGAGSARRRAGGRLMLEPGRARSPSPTRSLHRGGRVVLGARQCHTGMVVTRQPSYRPTPGTCPGTATSRGVGDAGRAALVDPGGSQSLGGLVLGTFGEAGGWRAADQRCGFSMSPPGRSTIWTWAAMFLS